MEVNLHQIVKYNNFVAINSESADKKKVNRVLWFSTCRKKENCAARLERVYGNLQ